MQSNTPQGQLCLKTLLAAELFSKLTTAQKEIVISLIEFLLSRG